jgi:hypothetical protein
MKINYKHQFIMFVVMVLAGMLFNPMSMLAYKFDHLYNSKTLFYGGLLMASNMIWAHEIVHKLSMNHFNIYLFLFGILLSIFIVFFILRKQLFITEKDWLKRMIPHHSTALTTTNQLLKNREKDLKSNPQLFRLAKDIIYNQEREIVLMKLMLEKYK